jgi:hypothetical protein
MPVLLELYTVLVYADNYTHKQKKTTLVKENAPQETCGKKSHVVLGGIKILHHSRQKKMKQRILDPTKDQEENGGLCTRSLHAC